MEAFGAAPNIIAEQTTIEARASACHVHRDNVETVVAFCSLSTQWRMAVGLASVYLGLDYAAIPAVLDRLLCVPHEKQQDVFLGLQVMERAALPFLNKRADG